MIVADYDRKWEPLSNEHKKKDEEIQQLLDRYATGALEDLAYAIIGTYGVGKTQFLFQIHKYAIERNMIPLYFLAGDLFKEVVENNVTCTPGNVYTLIEDKVSLVRECISNGNASEIYKVLDPREKVRKDAPKVLEAVLGEFSGKNIGGTKILLLVDELEGQYPILQKLDQTGERSPLMQWLESRTHLKFLAFAPAGIYELGGADRDRVKRKVIPPADVKYIRENLIRDAGKSNACWWLSRGKARQLFKTAEVLEKLEDETIQDAAKTSRIIKGELDSIGQPPTEVPPAVTDKISPSKIPFLLKLAPMPREGGRRYIICCEKLQTGELAEKLIEAFKMSKDNAILISEYFGKTVRALSDDEWLTYVDERDLPELFCLALDHFLEYEHGTPEFLKTSKEILSLYERSKEEHAAMHGTIGTLWDRREIERGLPLSMQEIRGAFPFPTMNPMVKDYVPDEMKKKWEGRNKPLWTWTEGNTTVLLFASARDFIAYSETDEFLSLSLPDTKGVLCLLPYGEDLRKEEKKPLFKWLEGNGKLKVVKLQHLLADFLLSASGELTAIPGNLQGILKDFKEAKEDILLSRKTEIYEKALSDTIKDELPKPETIYKGNPPDADNVWGRTQIGHRMIAVSGIALAFSHPRPEERILLADLRELFKGTREGRGAGDLRYLISSREPPGKGGHTRLPDRLLPYQARGAGITDTEVIEKVKTYWHSEEIDKIEELARILPLNNFLKLYQDEDVCRLLEAIWRTVRGDFEAEDLDGYIQKIQKDFIPTLNVCQELEEAGSKFGLGGIDFGDYEQLVKSLPGFGKLLDVVKESADASPLVKSIVSTLVESINDVDSDIRSLNNLCNNAKRAMEELKESAESLKRNFWEYRRAVKFIGLREQDMEEIINDQMKIGGVPDLEGVVREAKERKDYLDGLSTSLSRLEQKLTDLEDFFRATKGVK